MSQYQSLSHNSSDSIPSSSKINEINPEQYLFLGMKDRMEVQTKLKTASNGERSTFLIRSSSAGGYCVSKYNHTQRCYFHILISGQAGCYSLEDSDDSCVYKTLSDLVAQTSELTGYYPVGQFSNGIPSSPRVHSAYGSTSQFVGSNSSIPSVDNIQLVASSPSTNRRQLVRAKSTDSLTYQSIPPITSSNSPFEANNYNLEKDEFLSVSGNFSNNSPSTNQRRTNFLEKSEFARSSSSLGQAYAAIPSLKIATSSPQVVKRKPVEYSAFPSLKKQ